MVFLHALTLATARYHLAALADHADSIDASSAYERVLIELDRIHGDESPALDTDGICADWSNLFAAASSVRGARGVRRRRAQSRTRPGQALEDAYAIDGT